MNLPRMFEDFDAHFQSILDEWADFDSRLDSLIKATPTEDAHYYTSRHQSYYDSTDDGKSYSLSYIYETGMDEPEIKIEGDVDDEIINKFVKGVEDRLGGHLNNKPEGKIRRLLAPKRGEKLRESPNDASQKQFPSSKTYTLEMPGIAAENISTETKGKILTVKGNRDSIHYSKRIILPFNPGEIKVEANNGLINVIVDRA